MLWKLHRRAAVPSAVFTTPGALGQCGSNCKILAAAEPPDHSRRAEVSCRDNRDWRDLGCLGMLDV